MSAKLFSLLAVVCMTGCANNNALKADISSIGDEVRGQHDRIVMLERDNAVLNQQNYDMKQDNTQAKDVIHNLTVQVGILLGITSERPRDNIPPPSKISPPITIGD